MLEAFSTFPTRLQRFLYLLSYYNLFFGKLNLKEYPCIVEWIIVELSWLIDMNASS